MALSLPSLQQIATVKLATIVFNDASVNAVEKLLEIPLCLLPIELLEKIMDNLLPEYVQVSSLAEKVRKLARPISLEIEEWKEYHSRLLDTSVDFQNYFVWKTLGTIDSEATALSLIQSDRLEVGCRFALACFYCFEDFIPRLWKERSPFRKTRIVCRSEIVRVWVNWLENGCKGSIRESESFVYWAIRDDNPFATRYLLEGLTPEKRKSFLASITYKTDVSIAVLHVCFSQMDDCQRTELFQKCPFKLLKCFLNWPMQSQFLEKAKSAFQYLDVREFIELLFFIFLQRILADWKDFDYPDLLTKFWKLSPPALKITVLNGPYGPLFQHIVEHDWTKAYPTNILPVDLRNFNSSNFLLYSRQSYVMTRKRYLDSLAGKSLTPSKLLNF
ncbi:RNase H domain-containing protein [Nephila pilipes]|uniref:RNase H domain-containing protein n=1 Tax=Nephila pilipes TaxID=299642 RepID=A0A8X6NDD8_NEPPI|nr:RNase H domain-containing protein [Nephila pilipes]